MRKPRSDGMTGTRREQPLAFEVYLGGFHGASYGAWWTGEEIVYESFAAGWTDAEQLGLSPSAAQWQRFWRAVDELDVWSWAPRYEAAEPLATGEAVRDGVHWSLTLEHRGRRAESSGDSAGPDAADLDESAGFATFLDALSRLLGGRAFS